MEAQSSGRVWGRSSQTEAGLRVWEVLRAPGQLMLRGKPWGLGDGWVVLAPECWGKHLGSFAVKGGISPET